MDTSKINHIALKFADKVYDAAGIERIKQLIVAAIREGVDHHYNEDERAFEKFKDTNTGQECMMGQLTENKMKKIFEAGARARSANNMRHGNNSASNTPQR